MASKADAELPLGSAGFEIETDETQLLRQRASRPLRESL
jgi:hypothetical protein